LLVIGMAAPILAFVGVAAAALAYPGFNNATQYISALGGPSARHPEIFNAAILITGVGAVAAGLGFSLAVVALGGSRIAAGLTSLSFGLAGVGMVLASYYPWPDPRHLAINLGLGIQLAPLLLLWGLARVEGMAGLRRFLIVVFVAMAVLTVLTKHLIFKGLVNGANVGWWERAFAVVLVGWTGVAAFALERRLVFLARAAEPGEGSGS
jgi:glucan biosynthesis protein C